MTVSLRSARAKAALLFAALAAVLVQARTAEATPTCSVASTVLTITIGNSFGDGVRIAPSSSGRLGVYASPTSDGTGGIPMSCGAELTTATVDTVNFSFGGLGAAGPDLIAIDMTDAFLGPGATPEADGTGEIEVLLPDMAGSFDTLVIRGPAPGANIVVGTTGINPNGGDGDADWPVSSWSGLENVRIIGGAGDDRISGAGGSGSGAPAMQALTISGQDGADSLIGGAGADTLVGGAGNDSIDGGSGSDALIGGAGADALNGDAGADAIDGGADNDTINGGAGDDGSGGCGDWLDLTGGAGDDAINGGGGNDDLCGGAGSDMLAGDAGNDVVNGGSDNDTLDEGTTSNGSDVLDGGANAMTGGDTITYAGRTNTVTVSLDGTANDGESDELDTITGTTDVNDVIVGGAGADAMTAGNAAAALRGGAGNDALTGNGNDSVEGGAGDDTLNGSAGDVISFSQSTVAITADLSIVGPQATGEGNDTFGAGPTNLMGGSGNDSLGGNAGANTLNGGAGDDALNGRAGIDVELGGAGDDRFDQEARANGADTMDGGSGRDTVSYALRGNAITATNTSGADDGEAGEFDSIGTTVERIVGGTGNDLIASAGTLEGGPGDDTLRGMGPGDVLAGGPGDDEIFDYYASYSQPDVADYRGAEGPIDLDLEAGRASGEGNDTLIQIHAVIGSRFDDVIGGSGGQDVIDAGAGNDIVFARSGSDQVDGGDGDDELSGGLGDDRIEGAAGDDILTADAGNDTLIGGDGNDRLTGGADDDRLDAGDGDDLLDGGPGDDRIDGGAGEDLLDFAAASGSVVVDLQDGHASGAHGVETIRSVERLRGSAFDDELSGSAGNDVIDGLGGADAVAGVAGDDRLVGGTGNDHLDGGEGVDTCDGGDGRDRIANCENASSLLKDLLPIPFPLAGPIFRSHPASSSSKRS